MRCSTCCKQTSMYPDIHVAPARSLYASHIYLTTMHLLPMRSWMRCIGVKS